jgi:hypothetical protein
VITRAAPPVRSEVRAWPVALLLGSASFLVLFDSLAVATALPSIGAALEVGPGRAAVGGQQEGPDASAASQPA